MAIPWVYKRLNKDGVKMAITWAKHCFLTRQHHDLEVLLCQWSSETHNLVEVYSLTLEDKFGTPFLVWRLVTEEEDQVKLKFLIASMIASSSSRKLTYPTWLRFFYEDDGNPSDCVGLLTAMIRVSSGPADGLNMYIFSTSDFDRKACESRAGPSVLGFSRCKAG